MEGLEQKRQELLSMERALQEEHEAMALEKTKQVFPDNSVFQNVTSACVLSSDAFDRCMRRNLYDNAEILFELKSAEEWKLTGYFNKEMHTRPSAAPVEFTLLETGKKESIRHVIPIYVADSEYTIAIPVQLVPPSEMDGKYHNAIRVGEFWGHLEAFLAIYRDLMKSSPMKKKRPVSEGVFMHYFSYVRWTTY